MLLELVQRKIVSLIIRCAHILKQRILDAFMSSKTLIFIMMRYRVLQYAIRTRQGRCIKVFANNYDEIFLFTCVNWIKRGFVY